MYLAEVRFEIAEENEEVEELIPWLTGAWRSNGQVLGDEFPVVFQENAYRLFLMIPMADSLESSHDSQYVTRTKSRLIEAGVLGPIITLLGEDPCSAEPCQCPNRSSFILYTTYVCLESPLCCGDCFAPVPVYELANVGTSRGELHDAIRSWLSDYQACDRLQMNCQTGERFGLREMSRHDSSLSKRGREICEVISESVGIPAYYYLHRYKGRSVNAERKRKCPSCDGEWLLAETLHQKFDFKCDRCRLLSNIAYSF